MQGKIKVGSERGVTLLFSCRRDPRDYTFVKYIFIRYIKCMKTKVVPLIFILIALFLAAFFFYSRRFMTESEQSFSRAKVITTTQTENPGQESVKAPSTSENEKYETFVPLLPGETLIGTLTVDINNDGYDDEIIIVRKSTSKYLWIVPGIYNSQSHEYDRFDQIQTKFTKTRTFSYSAIDLIGDHHNSIIYQGIADDGNYVMEIFNCKVSPLGTPSIVNIGDFTSDGTIFIQQVERSENYELGISKGESFSIWVYKSEPADETPSLDAKKKKSSDPNQIQQEYRWNPYTGRYELAQQIKVNASRLVAKELSKILDGTEESFANFLNGLWYKTSNTEGAVRYLYFDYKNKEIVHLFADSQEVYQWDNSKLRHNGIYLTTVNADIMTLHRRFDISLVGTDEIRLSVRDDINLLIKENTMWDGNYKKLSLQNSFDDSKKALLLENVGKELKDAAAWQTVDAELSFKFSDFNYTFKNNASIADEESGVYSLIQAGNEIVLQFLSDSDNSLFAGYYSVRFGTKIISENVKKQLVEKQVTDYDSIVLTPVKITPTAAFATDGRSYQLSRSR